MIDRRIYIYVPVPAPMHKSVWVLGQKMLKKKHEVCFFLLTHFSS